MLNIYSQLKLFKKLSILIVMCYNVWNMIFAENAPKILPRLQGWAKLVLIALERYSVALKRLTFNLR